VADDRSTQLTKGQLSNRSKSRKLVIAQVIGGLQIGGAEKHFVNINNALARHQRIAIYVGGDRDDPGLYNDLDPQTVRVKIHIRKRSFLYGIWRLKKELEKYDCDVVHTHMFWANLYGVIAARWAGVPVIVTTEHGENRWKKSYHSWLERHVISRFTDKRFCVSRRILEQRLKTDGVPEEKLQVIANGTTVPAVPAQLWKNPQVVIGSVGRFVWQKDFCLFVDVIAELRKRDLDIRGCLVGDGPEMQNIRNKIVDMDLRDVIELTGFDTDTDKWFQYFDLYALTSREEGLPVSLLEAMSYGLPVVATNVGAVSEVLAGGAVGKVVPPEDVKHFADAVESYLNNKENASETGRQSRKRVEKEYSIKAIASQYESWYLNLLPQKGG